MQKHIRFINRPQTLHTNFSLSICIEMIKRNTLCPILWTCLPGKPSKKFKLQVTLSSEFIEGWIRRPRVTFLLKCHSRGVTKKTKSMKGADEEAENYL